MYSLDDNIKDSLLVEKQNSFQEAQSKFCKTLLEEILSKLRMTLYYFFSIFTRWHFF